MTRNLLLVPVALFLLTIFLLIAQPGAVYAQKDLKFPSLHLINEKGQFVDMKLFAYQATDGKTIQMPPWDWYQHQKNTPFTMKMEDVFKLRVEQGKGFKVVSPVDNPSDGTKKGIRATVEYASNDNWDHFIDYKTTSNFPGAAYKNTYFLNQHNPCFSEESFQFKKGSDHLVQVYATVYFKDDKTWAEYVVQVHLTGEDASDNPADGCAMLKGASSLEPRILSKENKP